MEPLNVPCKLCGHEFKWHQESTFGVWYCDFSDDCPCDTFWPVDSVTNELGIDIPMQPGDDDSFKYN